MGFPKTLEFHILAYFVRYLKAQAFMVFNFKK